MEKLKAHPFFRDHGYDEKWGNLLQEKSPLEAKAHLSSRPKRQAEQIETNPTDQ